jgi:TRAP-type C4-dicarboxylate transport system permease small subunit
MKRKTIIAWLGFFVIVVPFLGVPIAWKEYTLIAIGVLIVLISLAGTRRRVAETSRDSAYVESAVISKDKPQV